jgi:hypothetical protein
MAIIDFAVPSRRCTKHCGKNVRANLDVDALVLKTIANFHSKYTFLFYNDILCFKNVSSEGGGEEEFDDV